MKNARNITPTQAIEIGSKLLEVIIKGFENIGFRKKTNSRVETLEAYVITLNKRIEELEKIVKE